VPQGDGQGYPVSCESAAKEFDKQDMNCQEISAKKLGRAMGRGKTAFWLVPLEMARKRRLQTT
jgi:hypothetical protein